MKKKITLLLFTFLFSLSSTTFAKQINTDQAKKTALKLIAKKNKKHICTRFKTGVYSKGYFKPENTKPKFG